MKLGTIQHLFSQPGPFLSLHVDVSRNTEDAPQQLDARWTNLRHELARTEVEASLVERIEALLREDTDMPGEVRRTIVASGEDIVFDDVRAGHTIWPESTHLGPLPDLSGWLHQVDGEMPFILVTANREGAEIDFYRARSKPDAEHQEVQGDTYPISRVQPGGWSHRRFQQRAINTWKENAGEVADEIRTLASDQRPRLIVLAGEERALAELTSALEGSPVAVEQVAGGGRGEGASDEALWKDVTRILAQYEANDQREILEALAQASGQGTGAARGTVNVLQALVQGKVDRLLVDLQTVHDITVDPDDYPGLSLPTSTVTAGRLPADQVLVAAGALTDANLSLLPAEQVGSDGVAALLRWDD